MFSLWRQTSSPDVSTIEEITAAKKRIAGEMDAVRAQLDKASEGLGAEIAESILQGAR